MICVSIAQDSRRFALADMLNAARQCDLIEVRLDRFLKAPELGEIIAGKPKPLILTCRRVQDGGSWQGAEDERLALLRQCIVSKADYVEIELDVADQIRKFPPAQRVISYTNFQETPTDIADIYEEAKGKSPDVIKLVTMVRTPEEAWPLVEILARPTVPTVVVGLGRPGAMLTVLGKRLGAPWTYAALERGMESYPGLPTVADLEAVYRLADVKPSTHFVGVTGFTEQERVSVAALNALFAHLKRPERCLPLPVGQVRTFRKVINAVRLEAVLVDDEHQGAMLEIAAAVDAEAQAARAADCLLNRNQQWHAYNLTGKAVAAVLEETLRGKDGPEKALTGRHVVVVGTNPRARSVVLAVKKQGALVTVAARDREAAQAMAREAEGRFVAFEAIYSTRHEVLVLCSEERLPTQAAKAHADEPPIHPGYLNAGMTVMDLTALPRRTLLMEQAKGRGCTIVSPRRVLLVFLMLVSRLICGQEVHSDPLRETVRLMTEDEE